MPRPLREKWHGTESAEICGLSPRGESYDKGSTSHQLTTFHQRVLRGWS
jgi:hypothetical protein